MKEEEKIFKNLPFFQSSEGKEESTWPPPFSRFRAEEERSLKQYSETDDDPVWIDDDSDDEDDDDEIAKRFVFFYF